MFDYLQKFNSLPQPLRESVSSPSAMAVISDLENKYKIDLAATVMKVMIKIIPLADLAIYFVSDFSLNPEVAKKLTADLKDRLFFPVANYLGYNPSYSLVVPKTAPAPLHFSAVEKIAKESGVTFAGLELNSRFKNILTTYLKGVRSRIDTRLTLNKDILSGGLGLDYKIIDKIFKICDEINAGQKIESHPLLSLPENKPEKTLPAGNGLEKVRQLYEKTGEVRDIPYDLKSAILSGTVKKPATPLNLPVVAETNEKLLEEPAKEVLLSPVQVVNKQEVLAPVSKIETPIPVPTPAPISVPIPISTPATEATLNTLKEVSSTSQKLVQPPKKDGLLSKIFSTESEKKPTVKPEIAIKKPVVNTAPFVAPSIATLRNEASLQNKPAVKTPPIVQKPATEDVSVPKVMGPIEELSYLDIVNFRRLGSSPSEAALKVETKIRLLEKDGYDKMISGVLAWHSGIINSIYLKMGQEALAKGISFKQCAENYKNAKSSGFLFWEEIEAIMALNSRLMF